MNQEQRLNARQEKHLTELIAGVMPDEPRHLAAMLHVAVGALSMQAMRLRTWAPTAPPFLRDQLMQQAESISYLLANLWERTDEAIDRRMEADEPDGRGRKFCIRESKSALLDLVTGGRGAAVLDALPALARIYADVDLPE